MAVTPRYCVPARHQCHLMLAGLPADALKLYRTRMEPQARKGLDQGRANRDERLLRKVVDEAFCTPSGAAALDTLGDLAFERGHFPEAESWWRQLVPPPDVSPDAIEGKNGAPTDLLFPDPLPWGEGSAARVQAKEVLARIYQDPTTGWTSLLNDYRAKHGNAEGTLGGHKGKYADLLADLARQAQGVGRAAPAGDAGWSTYGGDATRGLILPAPPRFFDGLERLCRRGPTYRFDLFERKALGKNDALPAPEPATPSVLSRSLAFHPLIVGDQAADARSVIAYDLRTGDASQWFDMGDYTGLASPDLRLPLPSKGAADLLDLRYTMTLADDCLYVRLGVQRIYQAEDVDKNDPHRAASEKKRDESIASVLACLTVKPGLKGSRLRWATRPMVFAGREVTAQNGAIFEGAPVVHQGQLYIAATYVENDRTVTAVVSYPTAGAEGKGEGAPAPRWTQVVCATQELRGREKRARHHLLTVAGPNVVYCSHSGAIVALDAQTGKPAWGVRYAGRDVRENPTQPAVRDLAPPVYADGRLYVAPADYNHLLCLDPLSGRTLWDRERLEPTHLLGVGQGRLIFTTLQGLRAVDARDGSDAGGWQLPDGGGERAPVGRGLLVGDKVLWPTAKGIVVCNQADGALDYRPTLGAQVPLGNLAYANGCLAVADRTALSVFVPDGLLLQERKAQTRQTPQDRSAWLARARAEADRGQLDNALESLKKVQLELRPKEDRRFLEDIRREKLAVLLAQARSAANRADGEGARGAVAEATTPEQPAPARLEALVRTAEMWEDADDPARAVAV